MSASRNSSTADHLLAKIATALDRARITYMVIGGQAVLVHGVVRLTQDIDVTLGVALDALPRVRALIADIGLEPLVDVESFASETMVIPCSDTSSMLRVDFILSQSPYEREAIARARKVAFDGVDVRIASAEDVIIHKLIAGRARDLEDVRGILIKNPALDGELIRRWLREWGELIESPLVERFEEIQREARG